MSASTTEQKDGMAVFRARGKKRGAHQIDSHPEAPFRLIFADLLPVRERVPDVDAAVVGRAREELAIFGQRDGPDFTGLVAV